MKQTSIARLLPSFLALGVMLGSVPALAQSADELTSVDAATPVESDVSTDLEDEVVAYGKIIKGQHDGIDAFLNGDYETAEIEFELELKSLRRNKSAIENFAFASDVGADYAANAADAGSNINASQGRNGTGGVSGAPEVQSGNYGNTGRIRGKRAEGQTVLTDGRVTDTDFAIASYMAGLSEIKLGKFDEAKDSLKRALRYDPKNVDARMRLGMLYIQEGKIDRAADHLERLDRERSACVRISCERLSEINEAALGLAGHITKAIREQ